MYGFNDAKGFIPKFFANGSQPASSFTTTNGPNAFIQSGYAQNIGIGDAVILSGGYIKSATDGLTPTGNVYSIADRAIYGIFQGVQYDNDTNDTMYPKQPMLQSWRASTVTADGLPARAFVIPSCYMAVYTSQVGATGATIPCIGNFATLKVPAVAATLGSLTVLNNEQSTAYLDVGAGSGSAYAPGTYPATAGTFSSFQVVGFDDQATLPRASSSQIGLPYGNVLVMIANSTIPVGIRTYSNPA